MSEKPKVLVAAEIPFPTPEEMAEDCEVVSLAPDQDFRAVVREHPDLVGLIPVLEYPIDRETFEALPRLRVVSNYAVGYDNVDLEEATRRGVVVTNTPGVLTEATADLTFALILTCARRVVEGDRLVRAGRWEGWRPGLLLGTGLQGKRLGVVGLGRIGQAVAHRAAGFGVRLQYFSRTRKEELEPAMGLTFLPLNDLLRSSEILTLHVPLTDETHHLLGPEELALLPEGAIVVNTSRGPTVDEEALIRSLESGHLGAVGLDVYEAEPHVSPALIEHPRTVLLPHLGSATVEARQAMAALAQANLLAVLRGERPPHPVNPEVLE